ncbi:MAG TPA: hypothetical protein VEL28_17400 [Candidatus Binatia bacterium]|nr:hypothetical protein [Candidatus Binatia bacterium]
MKRQQHDDSPELQESRSTRREILRGGLLIAGAAAAARVVTGGARQAQAADGTPLILGEENTAQTPTSLVIPPRVRGLVIGTELSDPNNPDPDFSPVSALRAAGGVSIGIEGTSTSRIGVLGQSGGALVTDPNEVLRYGVYGASVDAIGVGGRSIDSVGVLGRTGGDLHLDPNESFPVAGIVGLAGFPNDPNDVRDLAGVFGYAQDPNNPAVLARNSTIDGLALNVEGRASFSSAGQGTIPAGVDRVEVAHPAVTASSIVLATLSSDPVGGRRLKFVEVGDGAFTVVLSGKAKVPVDFGFLVVN